MKDGETLIPGVDFLSTADVLLKLGQLYLGKGKFANQQILSEKWVDATFSDRVSL